MIRLEMIYFSLPIPFLTFLQCSCINFIVIKTVICFNFERTKNVTF